MTRLKFVLMLAAVFMAVAPAFADNGPSGSAGGDDPPLPVDGGWLRFQFGTAVSSNLEGPFTYNSGSTTVLWVTDAFNRGDQFAVFDNAVFLGNTSVPVNDGFDFGNPWDDPGGAESDPTFSHGTFMLAPGNHSITIDVIQNAVGFPGGGAGFLRADVSGVVPVPMAAWGGLSLLGLLGGSMVARRLRSR